MAMDKTFDAQSAENRIYQGWESSGAFKAGANAKDGAETFSIMIPPPNVNGRLHIGHAFNNTIQDILIRWHRMRGHDTLWQPGQDHAGIALQLAVEKELAQTSNRKRTDMTRDEFLEIAWEYKHRTANGIVDQLKRLGSSCDWSRNAFTMSGAPNAPEGEEGNFHDAVIKVFVDMYEQGYIYRGKRLVNWDPYFESAISDLEVENIETAGHMWHFKYPLAGGATYTYVEKDEDGNVTLEETRDYISIATTRPETMLGDGAVAVHPSDARYAPIVGQLCEIPVGPKEHRRLIPIITDDYPDPDFGSGAVKITGAHDFNDYGVASRGGIPMYRLMDTKGAMRDDGAPYAEAAARAQEIANGAEFTGAEVDTLNLVPDDIRGLDRFEARKVVIEQITSEGLAVTVKATDERAGQPKKLIVNDKGKDLQDWYGPDVIHVTLQDGEADIWQYPAPVAFRAKTFEDALTLAAAYYEEKDAFGHLIGEVAESFDAAKAHEFDGEMGQPIQLWHADDALVPLVENKPIMQPFGDRSKVVIEPMLTDQWFVDTDKIVGPAINAVRSGETNIMPEQDRKVYFNWLENIEPWCISRQLWWGHQIPVWYGPKKKTDGNIVAISYASSDLVRFCADSEEAAKKMAEEHYGQTVQVFSTEDGAREQIDKEFGRKAMKYARDSDIALRKLPIYRDPDVLDTWFSSGLWPIGTLGWPEDTDELKKYFPTSVLVTGFDIIFFWVARMMMMQYAVVGQKPFDHVYVHALVRDEKGKKMSKSLGNVLDPLELIDEYGADAVRFTLTAMAAMGRDLKLSTQRIAGYRNFGTKLWNAARFAELNEATTGQLAPTQYRRDTDAIPTPSQTVNTWIIGETARVREEVDHALNQFRFNDAAGALYAFVWGKVCDWYVEFSKPLLMDGDAETKAETQATMAWVIDQCLILLHPIMPFITEELWGTLGARDKPLVHADWPTYGSDLIDENADREMNWVISLIESIRSARQQVRVPVGLTIPVLCTDLNEAGKAAWERNEMMIKRLARIDSLTMTDTLPKGCITVAVDGGSFGLPLADVIDVKEEKARLEKTLGKLEKELGGLRGRLGNPKFVASAPEDVVQETRENLALREQEEAKLRAAFSQLTELET